MTIALLASIISYDETLIWFYIIAVIYYVYNSINVKKVNSLKTIYQLAYLIITNVVVCTLFSIINVEGLQNYALFINTLLISCIIFAMKRKSIYYIFVYS